MIIIIIIIIITFFRRRWRVYTLAAPSSNLPAETNSYADNYPFSVKVEVPLTASDLMRYQVP
jgi:hypothetical protein